MQLLSTMDIPVLVYIEIGKVQRNETCGFLMLQRVFHFLADHLDLHVRCLVKATKNIIPNEQRKKTWLFGLYRGLYYPVL